MNLIKPDKLTGPGLSFILAGNQLMSHLILHLFTLPFYCSLGERERALDKVFDFYQKNQWVRSVGIFGKLHDNIKELPPDCIPELSPPALGYVHTKQLTLVFQVLSWPLSLLISSGSIPFLKVPNDSAYTGLLSLQPPSFLFTFAFFVNLHRSLPWKLPYWLE